MKRHIQGARLLIVFVVIALLFGAACWRLFHIAWDQHQQYSQQAQAQVSGSMPFLRGNIYLRDSDQEFLVAANKKFPALNMVPSHLDQEHLQDMLARVSQITGVSIDQLMTAATSGISGSRAVAHHLTSDQVLQIQQAAFSGFSISYETDRSYPAGMLAADVLGFLGYDQTGRHGQYGVEASYEKELSGNQPDDVVLTIDKNIQSYAENALDGLLKKYHAASGDIIVEEPTTGRILAMADSPSFDPNAYASAPIAAFINASVQDSFEPGSSFKPFTMAAGLDLGKITPDTTYNDDKDIVVDGYTIKNFNEGHFGVVTMTKVLEKSINAGTMFVQSLLTHDQFLNYVVNDGFGQKTGIDLPGEVSGDIGNLYSGRPINFLTASFGQGISVTPIQLINGYSAIANGGKLMRPYVVASIRDAHGAVTQTQPEVVGTPFSAKTAATIRSMLVSVVDNGFDKARIPRYDIAGKTGTAQIADPVKGGYLEGQYNHTFVGFAPASDPKFVILIKMEKPQGITFAADSLSPVFKDVAQFLLNYLNIPPTR